MHGMGKIILSICLLQAFLSSKAQKDLIIAPDTTTDYTADCFTNFFDRTIELQENKTVLVTKTGKTISMTAFLKTGINADVRYGLIDLDSDGKKELVIYDFSGGAHCCDEFYFFKNIAPNKYQYVAKTFAGNVCVTEENEFLYDFNEQFGYFFTCYACAYEPESEMAANPVHNIFLKYNKGKLSVLPGDSELRRQINDYLGRLSEEPYQKLQNEDDQDNGLRKEFAFHLAVYYYSFGRNLAETKKLFDKYYKYPDAKKVWVQFVSILSWIKKQNDF